MAWFVIGGIYLAAFVSCVSAAVAAARRPASTGPATQPGIGLGMHLLLGPVLVLMSVWAIVEGASDYFMDEPDSAVTWVLAYAGLAGSLATTVGGWWLRRGGERAVER